MECEIRAATLPSRWHEFTHCLRRWASGPNCRKWKWPQLHAATPSAAVGRVRTQCPSSADGHMSDASKTQRASCAPSMRADGSDDITAEPPPVVPMLATQQHNARRTA